MDILILFYLLGHDAPKSEGDPTLEFALIIFVLIAAAREIISPYSDRKEWKWKPRPKM